MIAIQVNLKTVKIQIEFLDINRPCLLINSFNILFLLLWLLTVLTLYDTIYGINHKVEAMANYVCFNTNHI